MASSPPVQINTSLSIVSRTWCVVFALLLVSSVNCSQAVQAQEQKQEHPLVPAIAIVQKSLTKVTTFQDYTATFTKREIVNGKLLSQQMQLKLRQEPFSVYMKFTKPTVGREILYVHGKNNNQLRAHEGSGVAALIGTISLPLNSPRVTAENRHPITNMGIKNLLELLLKQWKIESKYGEINVNFYPDAKMGNVACQVIEVTHPRPRKQFPFHKTRLFIDKKSQIPIRVENYTWPAQAGGAAQIVEEYTYTGIRPNIGLTDADFSESNPKYSF